MILLAIAVLCVAVLFIANPHSHRFSTAAAPPPAAADGSNAGAADASALSTSDAQMGQLVLARCGSCHGLERLQQHPQDAAGWLKTVRQMEQMGAQVQPDEEAPLVDYLSRHFGPKSD